MFRKMSLIYYWFSPFLFQFRKYYLIILSFLLAIKSSFATNHGIAGSLVDTIGTIFNSATGLILNEYVVFGIIFIGIMAITYYIFRIPLSTIFKKETKVISIVLSLISTSTLFYLVTRNSSDGISSAIAIFGGTIGLIFLSILGVLALGITDRLIVNHRKRMSSLWIIGISGAGFLITSLILVVMEQTAQLHRTGDFFESLQGILSSVRSILVLILIIGSIYSLVHSKKKDKKDKAEENPKVKKASHIIDKNTGNDEKMKEILKKIKDEMNELNKMGGS